MSLWRRPRSVRVRLTLTYVGAMLVVLAVYAGVVYVSVQNNLSDELNRRLEEDFKWPKDMLYELPAGNAIGGEEAGGEGSPWLQVFWTDAGTGEKRAISTYTAKTNPIPGAEFWAEHPDGQIKILSDTSPTYRVLTGEAKIGKIPVVIQVAVSEKPMQDYLRELLFYMLLGLPLAVAVAGLGGYTLARRALAPVDRMAERARSITAERLTDRLPVDNPNDELGRLASVFNETLTRLESSFDQMRRFTADASHELRTPLTAMRSVGEVGLRGKRDPAAYREIIGSMLEEVDRLSLLVDRLLTLSRADTGEALLASDAVDLGELAEEVTAQLDVLAEEKQQSLTVERNGVSRCIGDRLVLRQALLNLVDNAIKYSPVGGKITVRVAKSTTGTTLDVTDTGPGIPAELQPRVFDRFYRVDGARSRENGGGTGLGLSIARWAVEVNGGQLTLENGSGSGATFRITIPNKA
jgi:heavy metal sensor kinase